MRTWLYLIHFDKELSHARHYFGSTANLGVRLRRHAEGRGAAILSHLLSIGVGWTVTKVWSIEGSLPFLLERQIKNQKNTPRYCPQCNYVDVPIPGATSFPVNSLPSTFLTTVESKNVPHQ